jgi:amino acid transporter
MNSSSSAPRLLRVLGPLAATAIVVGTVIGSGVFKKPQQVAEHVPYSGLAAMAWVLGGLLALMGALVLAEVAVLFPRAGGNYVYLRESYGRLAAFLFGWVDFLINRAASIGALATVFTQALTSILANTAFRQAVGLASTGEPIAYWPQQGMTVGVILLLALVNVGGVRWSAGLQSFITAIKIGTLLVILTLPFVALAVPSTGMPPPRPANLTPAWPQLGGDLDWYRLLTGFGVALVGVLWAYHGWMNVAPVAEEVRNPQRNLPLALFAGVGIIIFLYLGANLAYYLVLPREEMAGMKYKTVVTEFSLRMLGPIGEAAASAALMISVFGALNGNLLVGPRIVYAMAQDGLAPGAMARIHPRFHTPAVATLVLGAWASLLVLVAAALTQFSLPVLDLGGLKLDVNLPRDSDPFDLLTDCVVFGAVLFETLAVSSIFLLRRRRPDLQRPYRCLGYPIVPILYVAIMAVVAVYMLMSKRTASLYGLVIIGVAAGVFVIWRLHRHPASKGSVDAS